MVKTLKKSIYASLGADNGINLDTIINRFLCCYRNTRHCVTGESHAKLFFGRSLRTRFSSLKPPLNENVILDNQEKAISNYKGKRMEEFSKVQEVIIHDYTDPNKQVWSPATIKEKIGSLSYC